MCLQLVLSLIVFTLFAVVIQAFAKVILMLFEAIVCSLFVKFDFLEKFHHRFATMTHWVRKSARMKFKFQKVRYKQTALTTLVIIGIIYSCRLIFFNRDFL